MLLWGYWDPELFPSLSLLPDHHEVNKLDLLSTLAMTFCVTTHPEQQRQVKLWSSKAFALNKVFYVGCFITVIRR